MAIISSDPLAAALSLIGMLKGIIEKLKEENKELKSFLRGLGYTMVIDKKGRVSMRYEHIRCIKPERTVFSAPFTILKLLVKNMVRAVISANKFQAQLEELGKNIKEVNRMVNLGDKAKDTVSGYVGIAVCKSTYLQGCDRIALQAVVKKNEKPQEWQYFAEPQLKVLKRNVIGQGSKVTGGFKPDRAEKPF